MTAPTTPEQERAAFEAWHQLNYPQQFSRFFDTYEIPAVRTRWQGWQARAALSAPSAFPPRILALLHEVADRKGTEFRGPFEDGNGEPLQDDADAALMWIGASK